MRGKSTNQKTIDKIISLRHLGYSYSEISRECKIGKATLSVLLKNILLSKEALSTLVSKKYKSRNISLDEWKSAKDWAGAKIHKINQKDKMLILSMLYWGEGTKKELNIINGDPLLLKVFLNCLRDMGIKEDDIKISLRIFDKKLKDESIIFWAEILSVDKDTITRFEFVEGKKSGRLPHGMCRIRIKKGALYFKRIMSMISRVKELFDLSPL